MSRFSIYAQFDEIIMKNFFCKVQFVRNKRKTINYELWVEERKKFSKLHTPQWIIAHRGEVHTQKRNPLISGWTKGKNKWKECKLHWGAIHWCGME